MENRLWAKKQTNSALSNLTNIFKMRFYEILMVSVLVVVVIATWTLQNRVVGWEKGHHGWVSSHGLAIMSKSNLGNRFVGYALAYSDSEGEIEYEYFDRYPVFFSAAFNVVLSLRDSFSAKIYLAKQAMNLIYLGTLFLAFLIVSKFIGKLVALAITVLAFSNPMLLYYKDMVHFDQPALFGFLLVIFSIILYKFAGKKWAVYVAALIAVGLGRGYAAWAVLFNWLVLEAIITLKKRDIGLWAKFKQIVTHDAFIVLGIAVIWGASLLFYNILIEANKRDVPLAQTSIVTSATDRLSLSEEFNEANYRLINWSYFTRVQIGRIIRWIIPVHLQEFVDPINIAIFGLMSLPVVLYIRKETPQKRMILLIMALSGFVWLFPMRNMAAPHEYTTMYYIGLSLVFYLSLFSFLKPANEAASYLLVFSAIIFVAGLVNVRDVHLAQAREDKVDQYTSDFTRIRELIEEDGMYIYWDEGVQYAPYAPGFYLPDQFISPLAQADYVLSRDRNFLANNLTPENFKMFLFKP